MTFGQRTMLLLFPVVFFSTCSASISVKSSRTNASCDSNNPESCGLPAPASDCTKNCEIANAVDNPVTEPKSAASLWFAAHELICNVVDLNQYIATAGCQFFSNTNDSKTPVVPPLELIVAIELFSDAIGTTTLIFDKKSGVFAGSFDPTYFQEIFVNFEIKNQSGSQVSGDSATNKGSFSIAESVAKLKAKKINVAVPDYMKPIVWKKLKSTQIAENESADAFERPYLSNGHLFFFLDYRKDRTEPHLVNLFTLPQSLTLPVKTVHFGPNDAIFDFNHHSRIEKVLDFGSKLIFLAYNDEDPRRLRFYRMTPGSSDAPQEICANGASSQDDIGLHINFVLNFNQKLYYRGIYNGKTELLSCNSETGAVTQPADTNISGNDSPTNLMAGDSVLYFRSSNSSNKTKLFRLTAGEIATQISDTISGHDNPVPMATLGNSVLFRSAIAANIEKLFAFSDESGVQQLGDFMGPGVDESIISVSTQGGSFYFVSMTHDSKMKLFRATLNTTTNLFEVLESTANTDYTQFGQIQKEGDNLFLTAINTTGTRRLLRIGTDHAVQEINPYQAGPDVSSVAVIFGKFESIMGKSYFRCSNKKGASRLCSINGEGSAEIVKVQLNLPDGIDADPYVLGMVGGNLLISSNRLSGEPEVSLIVDGQLHRQNIGKNRSVSHYANFFTNGERTLIPLRTTSSEKSQLQYFILE